MSNTFTALDELHLQDWKACDENGVEMQRCFIASGLAADLVKLLMPFKSLPFPGKSLRLDDARGLVLMNTGIDYQLTTRWL